jgi:hypothetical protein
MLWAALCQSEITKKVGNTMTEGEPDLWGARPRESRADLWPGLWVLDWQAACGVGS